MPNTGESPMTNRRTVLQMAAATGIASLVSPLGAVAQNKGSGGAGKAQTLTAVMQAPLRSLDPIITTAYIVRNYGYMVYDTLLALDAQGKIQLQMLEKWTASSDGKTYTFILRDGLQWSDGKPVTSNDCIASIKRWAAVDTMGQVMNGLLVGMQAVDDKSWSMQFSAPTNIAIRALAKPSASPAFMMPERIAKTPASTPITESIGSGPFNFVKDEYKPGVQAVFEKNVHYVPRKEPPSGLAGGKVVHVERVKWISMPDIMTTVNALRSGEIDFIETAPYDLLPLLEKDSNVKIIVSSLMDDYALARFNFLYPPFNNKLLRQAAMAAMNQKDVLQALVGNTKYYRTCYSTYGCGNPYASSIGADSFAKGNIELAKKLLKQGKYDGTPVVLLYPTDIALVTPTPPVLAQALRSVGFKVDMQSMDWQTLLVRRASQKKPSDGGWNLFSTDLSLADARDPLSNIDLAANGKKAWVGWPDVPEIEKLRDQFARTADEQQLKKLAGEIQKVAFDEGLLVPLGQFSIPMAASKSLGGILLSYLPVFWNVKKASA